MTWDPMLLTLLAVFGVSGLQRGDSTARGASGEDLL